MPAPEIIPAMTRRSDMEVSLTVSRELAEEYIREGLLASVRRALGPEETVSPEELQSTFERAIREFFPENVLIEVTAHDPTEQEMRDRVVWLSVTVRRQ